jgi:ABC-type protease/lipase transport system fused ATPase/permease subunit
MVGHDTAKISNVVRLYPRTVTPPNSRVPAASGETMIPVHPLRATARRIVRTLIWIGLFSLGLQLIVIGAPFVLKAAVDAAMARPGEGTLIALVAAVALPPLIMAGLEHARARILVHSVTGIDLRLADPLMNAGAMKASRRKADLAGVLRDLTDLRSALTVPTVMPLIDAPWTLAAVGAIFLIDPLLGVTAALGTAAMAALAFVPGLPGRTAAIHGVQPLLLIAVAGIGGWLMAGHGLSAGAVVAALMLLARALAPIESLPAAGRSALAARAAWRRLDETLNTARAVPPAVIVLLQPVAAGREMNDMSRGPEKSVRP